MLQYVFSKPFLPIPWIQNFYRLEKGWRPLLFGNWSLRIPMVASCPKLFCNNVQLQPKFPTDALLDPNCSKPLDMVLVILDMYEWSNISSKSCAKREGIINYYQIFDLSSCAKKRDKNLVNFFRPAATSWGKMTATRRWLRLLEITALLVPLERQRKRTENHKI